MRARPWALSRSRFEPRSSLGSPRAGTPRAAAPRARATVRAQVELDLAASAAAPEPRGDSALAGRHAPPRFPALPLSLSSSHRSSPPPASTTISMPFMLGDLVQAVSRVLKRAVSIGCVHSRPGPSPLPRTRSCARAPLEPTLTRSRPYAAALRPSRSPPSPTRPSSSRSTFARTRMYAVSSSRVPGTAFRPPSCRTARRSSSPPGLPARSTRHTRRCPSYCLGNSGSGQST